MMEEDLRSRLRADQAVAAIAGARVDWGLRPDNNNASAITLTTVSTGAFYTYRGRDRMSSPRVQIDCWGATPGAAVKLARAVEALMERPGEQGATIFGAAQLEVETGPEADEAAGGTVIYRCIRDFAVWHRPAA
jgi:hypothetical protein